MFIGADGIRTRGAQAALDPPRTPHATQFPWRQHEKHPHDRSVEDRVDRETGPDNGAVAQPFNALLPRQWSQYLMHWHDLVGKCH